MLILTEPLAMRRTPIPFITNHALRPTSLRTTSCNGLRSPGAPGKALRRWCGVVPVTQCHRRGQQEVSPIYSHWDIKQIITILRVVKCFQCRHTGAIEELRASVCCSRGREQEQYPRIVVAAYHTVDGDTTKAPWSIVESIPGGRIMTRSRR